MPINHFKGAIAKISLQTYSIYSTAEPTPGAFINIVDNDEVTTITDNKINNYTYESSGWIKISIKINALPESKGIFAKIANEFAAMDISVFPVASFSQAHILVKKEDIDRAKIALNNLGIHL